MKKYLPFISIFHLQLPETVRICAVLQYKIPSYLQPLLLISNELPEKSPMKNKTLAIFGIVSYLLSVLASQTSNEGASTAPVYIVIISGIAAFLYTVIATIRLWKISKLTSLLFAIISAIFFGFEILQVTLSPASGTLLILIINIISVVNLLVYFYVIFLLFRIDKYQALTEQSNADEKP